MVIAVIFGMGGVLGVGFDVGSLMVGNGVVQVVVMKKMVAAVKMMKTIILVERWWQKKAMVIDGDGIATVTETTINDDDVAVANQ